MSKFFMDLLVVPAESIVAGFVIGVFALFAIGRTRRLPTWAKVPLRGLAAIVGGFYTLAFGLVASVQMYVDLVSNPTSFALAISTSLTMSALTYLFMSIHDPNAFDDFDVQRPTGKASTEAKAPAPRAANVKADALQATEAPEAGHVAANVTYIHQPSPHTH